MGNPYASVSKSTTLRVGNCAIACRNGAASVKVADVNVNAYTSRAPTAPIEYTTRTIPGPPDQMSGSDSSIAGVLVT